MIVMAKSKAAAEKEASQSRQVAFRLPPDLWQALDAFLAAQRIPPTQTDTMIVSLQEFLQREGFYPPKKS
jgi:hypothetical protein